MYGSRRYAPLIGGPLPRNPAKREPARQNGENAGPGNTEVIKQRPFSRLVSCQEPIAFRQVDLT